MRTRWIDTLLDVWTYYIWAPLAGLVFGIAFGWWIGVLVTAAVLLVMLGVARGAERLVRKSLQTKVKQREFPRPGRTDLHGES